MSGPETIPHLRLVPGWMRKHTPLLSRLLEQLAAVRVLDCATRLAAQAFLGTVPAVFVIAALAPDWLQQQLVTSIRTTLGLSDATLDQVQSVYSATDVAAVASTGGVGIVVTLLSATACSRALQKTCERSWHLPKSKARVAAWRWLAWLVVWLVALLFQGLVQTAFGTSRITGFTLAAVSGTLLWWWTQHLLLGSRIPWLPLLPGALLAGFGEQVLTVASRVYMPHAVDRSLQQFGSLGSVFVLLSWLIAFFIVVTLAIAVGYVVAREPLPAAWLRTPVDPVTP
ncbi:YhjD/YihY/BrkB family envelope integrity protein [Streptomyces sp. NBC_01264]|uniref:YhjD/YihY/BrkB family envelope integrity protein n=1 Tax=Streptomyces sp. NBC_01264 TaxID=2903804 RepID=UPI002254752C|nr:YhjD/YihY/BrkB family envelope integrity protein [Streptomyces sp. NBC_01264]MCX4782341.1 YihY/virulence factor BrkB family protein [Streptomyces sp. NBC_01264]